MQRDPNSNDEPLPAAVLASRLVRWN